MRSATQQDQFERKGNGTKMLNRILSYGFILVCCCSLACETNDAITVNDKDDFAIDLDYSQEEMFGFSIDKYLQDNASHLSPYAEMISHVAGKERISPRALIALMEQQSSALGNPKFDASKPFGELSGKTGFKEQLQDVAARLRAIGEKSDLRVVVSSPADDLLTVLPAEDISLLSDVYQRLFPGVDAAQKVVERATLALPALQFPYPIGQSWLFSGTHADNGTGSTMSSMDFAQKEGRWGDTISVYVVAAAAGIAKVHSSCYVTIVHNSTWTTSYYHLSNIVVRDGQSVKADQPIAKYANSYNQALCDGGTSWGPHVHWTLLSSNRETSLSGRVLSGWSIHPGSSNYDENCSRMYLTKSGTKVCPWDDAVRNTGTSGQTDNCPNDPNKTEPGLCGCGVPEGSCSQGPSISMSKSIYAVGETIKVNFSGMSGSSTDWIGLYKTGAAHSSYLVYQYTGSGMKSGTLSFAGRSAGSYEARLFLNDSYTLKKKVSFTVK